MARVALARVIALDLMLIMYDEPFGSIRSLGVVGDDPAAERRAGITSVVDPSLTNR
jgi:ABC-type transporter Mla maintaining outer membrane lipid asymmetry ATPase subunit MlaF